MDVITQLSEAQKLLENAVQEASNREAESALCRYQLDAMNVSLARLENLVHHMTAFETETSDGKNGTNEQKTAVMVTDDSSHLDVIASNLAQRLAKITEGVSQLLALTSTHYARPSQRAPERIASGDNNPQAQSPGCFYDIAVDPPPAVATVQGLPPLAPMADGGAKSGVLSPTNSSIDSPLKRKTSEMFQPRQTHSSLRNINSRGVNTILTLNVCEGSQTPCERSGSSSVWSPSIPPGAETLSSNSQMVSTESFDIAAAAFHSHAAGFPTS